jgi:hypothetical protein
MKVSPDERDYAGAGLVDHWTKYANLSFSGDSLTV